MILVKKKDETWQLCVDYRALIPVTIKDRFPIPTVEELLNEFCGHTGLLQDGSLVWLPSGTNLASNIVKSTFQTREGYYEFFTKVTPFGLSNMPSTLQVLMNFIFWRVLWKFALVFFDDILIYNPTWEAHAKHLNTILSFAPTGCLQSSPNANLATQRIDTLAIRSRAKELKLTPPKSAFQQ